MVPKTPNFCPIFDSAKDVFFRHFLGWGGARLVFENINKTTPAGVWGTRVMHHLHRRTKKQQITGKNYFYVFWG